MLTLLPIAYFISRSIFRSHIRTINFQIELVKEAKRNQKLTKKLRVVNRKLKLQATLDPLTKLFNRRAFNDYIEKLKLSKTPYTLTVIMIDVDDFKRYNDTYGHSKGDDVLTEIGKFLQEISNQHQLFVARWGGEEFSILLINKSANFVESLCQQICEGITNLRIAHIASRVAPVISVSIGASTKKINSIEGIQTCFQYADELLYSVKENGRNGFIHKEYEQLHYTISKVDR